MSALRLVLVLFVIGGLILLILQNSSLTLSLTFLGLETQALSLGLWLLFSLGAGFLTSLVLAGLLRFALYLNAPLLPSAARRPNTRASETPKPPRTPRPPETTKTRLQVDAPPPGAGVQPEPTVKTPSPAPTAESWTDDWAASPSKIGDWDDPPVKRSPSPTPVPSATPIPTPTPPSGTTYSYKPQDRDRSGVGRTEDVYDANFRVIIPPPSSEQPKPTQEDDWEAGDDEDWI
ncbi:MAG: hypothetical protein F6K32_07445 [Desertifilum sp. SIO1I2]|nr:hypothetical protein [Desertifilum sp. SIO1I2]